MTLDFNHGAGPVGGGHKQARSDIVSDDVNYHVNNALYRQYYDGRINYPRHYVGMSELGHRCAREIYLAHTGAPQPAITGEKLRRFAMGHIFEKMVLDWLLAAGFKIVTSDRNGNQFEFTDAGGRIAGHIDGVILECPYVPNIILPALWENKALMAKYWTQIVKHGLMKAEFSYYVQIQLYMAHSGLRCCLFTIINKDTAEIHHCVITFDPAVAQKFSDRGADIVRAIEIGNMPPRVSANSDFYVCKICDFHDYCWSLPT